MANVSALMNPLKKDGAEKNFFCGLKDFFVGYLLFFAVC